MTNEIVTRCRRGVTRLLVATKSTAQKNIMHDDLLVESAHGIRRQYLEETA